MQESVEVPEPVTLVGASVHVRPVAGIMFEVRLMTPVKPWSAVRVMVEVAADPAFTVLPVGLVAMVKS